MEGLRYLHLVAVVLLKVMMVKVEEEAVVVLEQVRLEHDKTIRKLVVMVEIQIFKAPLKGIH